MSAARWHSGAAATIPTLGYVIPVLDVICGTASAILMMLDTFTKWDTLAAAPPPPPYRRRLTVVAIPSR